MVRSRRSISKEDKSSVLADSGVSLSSPPSSEQKLHFSPNLTEDEEEAILAKLCVSDEDQSSSSQDTDKLEFITEYSNNSGDQVVRVSDNVQQSVKDVKREYQRENSAKRKEKEKRKLIENVNSDGEANDFKLEGGGAAAAVGKRLRKSYICDVCHKEFGGNTDLKRHKLIHSDEKPYSCEQCGKRYRQAINLKNHVTTAHGKIKKYTCDQCPKAFALKERLKLHMRVHSGEKPYSCSKCSKRFARGGQLHQHMLGHHQDAPKKFKCEKCSARFSTSSYLKAHTERHEQGPDHYCELCKEHFVNEVFLKTHRNKVHYILKKMECEICNKFIEEHNLSAHIKTHSNNKSLVCQICNSLFTQKSQFNVHMRMHTSERPYQCRICCQAFAHSSVLKLHIRKHTGEKPFVCMLCKDDVAFSQLAHLKTHMKKIHNQINSYMCEGCQEFFKIKIELEAHQHKCAKYSTNLEEQAARCNEAQILSHIRFHMAILLKKITSDQKLQQLGFEKRLIDNVIVASLKLANRKVYTDLHLSAMQRMRLNVEEFLNWTVPAEVMQEFQEQKLCVESILEKIVSMYMKQK